MATTTYLITGAARGIGLGFVLALAQRENVKIFATVRDASKATELLAAQEKYGNITILTWRADSPPDSVKVAEEVKKEVGHLDVVICNAGVNTESLPVVATSLDALQQDFTINAGGPLHLFQAVHALIEASPSGKGIFLPISSLMGSIGACPPYPSTSYGVSKAALNYIAKKIAAEHEKVKVILVHPGLVKTDMSAAAKAKMGITFELPGELTVEQSVTQIVAIIDGADKVESGSFVTEKGEAIPW